MDGVTNRRKFARLYFNKLRRAFNTLSALSLLSMSIILVLRMLIFTASHMWFKTRISGLLCATSWTEIVVDTVQACTLR